MKIEDVMQPLLDLAGSSDPVAAEQALLRARVALGADADRWSPLLSVLALRTYQVSRLLDLVGKDALTGAANRRSFDEELTRELARVERRGSSLALLMIDLDGLKRINDVYGHAEGDRAILSLSQACRDAIRATDLVARLGGDEFAVLLPDAGEFEALAVAERIRRGVARHRVQDRCLSTSVGVACAVAGESAGELLARADVALYADKRGAGNVIALEVA
ncbi:MAG: GGDEF domain-containing protein [Deltaproteobacteria bacterium]|nr:GGDEF domain-containing protein [Deltaproteobacteria bacterium]